MDNLHDRAQWTRGIIITLILMDQETSLSEKHPQELHQSHPLPLKLDDHPNAEKRRIAVNIPKNLIHYYC